MKGKQIDKEIFGLAVPNVISNISVPLISTVDTFLMGQLSVAHLAAVGLSSMIFNMIYWNFGFLRMGTTGITAQAFGANNPKEQISSLVRSAILALTLALLLLLFQQPLYNMTAFLLNVDPGINGLVETYYEIRILAAPASLLLFVLLGWFFGMQNAIYPLIITVVINLLNSGLSYYLVVHHQMDIEGVAWGTVVAQYCGLLVAVLLIVKRYIHLIPHFEKEAVSKLKEYGSFFQVNFDLFIRTVCLTGAFAFFYSQSSLMGELVLATNVVLMQFVNWMSYGIDGFAYASESIVGKYKGAKDPKRLELSIRKSFFWAGVLAIMYAVCYWLFGVELISFFSDDVPVQLAGAELIWAIAVFPLLAYWSYIWDGIFVGLTASKAMRNSMIASLLVYIAVFYFLPTFGTGISIWIALLSLMVARGLFQWIYFKKYGVALQ